ncbi:MAG TPA: DUF1987 domain-containing protein [Bacteroidales bacterium]|nr:DUF1987 domain-containing protein [Bacteroidales bacterium]
METLKIAPTEDTPEVNMDVDNNKFMFSGRSLPEDVVNFYQPVLDWLDAFEASPIENAEFEFKLEYFNTASSKLILDILLKINDIFEDGTPLKVKWYYMEMDIDLEEAGEEYSELVEVPFELVAY